MTTLTRRQVATLRHFAATEHSCRGRVLHKSKTCASSGELHQLRQRGLVQYVHEPCTGWRLTPQGRDAAIVRAGQ